MIQNIRYRVEGELVVLQVLEIKPKTNYSYGDSTEWRDAKVEDLLDVAGVTTKTVYIKADTDCGMDYQP